MPTQPRTVSQVTQRARLSDMSAGWRGLTATQIASWNAFANSFTVTNSLGSTITLTGHQCYVKVNTVNLLNGVAAVSTPPALPAFVANTITALTSTAGTPTLAVAGATPAGSTVYMYFVSPQQSAGRNYNGQFYWIVTGTTFTAGSFNLLTAYEAKFGAPIAGKKIFLKVVQSQAGMQDNGTLYSCIVGA